MMCSVKDIGITVDEMSAPSLHIL